MTTLQQLLDTLDKSDKNKSWISIEELGQEFGLSLCGINYEGDELQSFYHQDARWVCTDTDVGLKFWFLDGEFVGVSTQEARKSDEFFQWKNQAARTKIFEWLLENFVKDPEEPKEFELNMEIDCSSWLERKKEMDQWNEEYRQKYLARLKK